MHVETSAVVWVAIAYVVLGIVFLVGVGVMASSFDKPKGYRFSNRAGALGDPEKWQKWVFVIWMVAGPLCLLLDWYFYGSKLQGPDFTQFQHRQKLLSDLWSGGSVLFGVFWGTQEVDTMRGSRRARRD